MSKYFLVLQTVNETVNDFTSKSTNLLTMKRIYSEPKISTGGVDITQWNKLSTKQKKEALEKDWFIYYSFRDEKTGKLKRMPHVKAGVNRYHTKEERFEYLKTVKSALLFLLEKGLNPYKDNDLSNLDLKLEENHSTKFVQIVKEKEVATEKPTELTIQEALDFVFKLKYKTLSSTSYRNFENRINKFASNFDKSNPISSIDRKAVNEYLNDILINNSARTRNNHRTDLSSFFQTLEDNDIVASNFVKKIKILSSKAEKNKTYTTEQEKEIFAYLEQNDPLLLLYIKFISYNFLRPVEVNRLLVKSINLKEKKLSIKTKTNKLKTKIIPDILLQELPDLSQLNQDNYLFTPNGLGLEWVVEENNRRDSFSKRFKTVIKDHFNLGSEYGLYSFRHTFITKLYRNLREDKSPFETKSILMNITGHSTMDALEKYLRDIDAELPEDYSNLFR
ncbi:site-specific integrase [Flavobacterium sp. HXWNR29]|uniref:tyrosine-type recombinase/integrase n=1 Tax=Flavobacterium odoriferum TaxID=2946604 RepID=UPI0021CB0200|nr:site-specific integrase [Flavobacterium sp. HXWNR29]MCU4188625.1 site-specific integrase [Flavobacterium sp. HXWNR29]